MVESPERSVSRIVGLVDEERRARWTRPLADGALADPFLAGFRGPVA